MFYDGQENWAKTDSVYEAALKIDSTNALVNNNYAYSLSERDKRLDDALRMAKIAIEQEPESPSYLDTIGWVYFKLNDYKKAKDYIEKAIEIGGESSVMLEHLGDIYFKMNQKDIAHDYWQKALKIDNDNDSLKQKVEKGEI